MLIFSPYLNEERSFKTFCYVLLVQFDEFIKFSWWQNSWNPSFSFNLDIYFRCGCYLEFDIDGDKL